MAVLKNSRNTQLASTDSAARIITTQKTIEVTSNTSLVNYTSSGTLVAGQTLQIVAKLKGMSAAIQWQLSSPGVKLYVDSAGVTEVTKTAAGVYQVTPTYVALTDSFDAAVWVLASEFNTQALTTLRVTALATDSDQVSGFVNFIKLQASPGSSTFTASLYLQSASYPVGTPPAAPTGGTYSFSNSTLTAPAKPLGTTDENWWRVTQPAASTNPTWACEYNFTGTSVDTVTADLWKNVRIDTVTGSAGTRTAILDLYRWVNATDAATVATTNLPSGTAVYTWSNATFAAKSGNSFPNSTLWKTTPAVPSPGQTLYIARQVYADTGSSLTSEVTWSTAPNSFSVLPIAFAGNNGTRTAFLEIYRWVSGTTAPTVTFAANSVSPYNWADGTFTLPAGIIAAGWSLAPGAAIAGGTLWAVSVSYADALTTSPTDITWPTSPVPYVIGAAGAGGVSQNRVELYWQATTVTAVNTATRYTFSSDTLVALAGGSLGNWSRTIPNSSTTPTWMTSCLFTATAPLDYDDREVVENSVNSWSTPVVYAKNGVPGINGTKTAIISAFLWANTVPTTYPGAAVYTWPTVAAPAAVVSAYPAVVPATSPASTWQSSAGTAPGTGYTLYQITVLLTADVADLTTGFNWSSATRNSIGYRQDGTIGPQGASYRIAYIVTTNPALPGKPANTTASSAESTAYAPTETITYGGVTSSWSIYATSVLDPGQYMYQTDGIWDPESGVITWGNPYLSNLKVGSLSAITANVGNLTIASGGNIQTLNKGYAVAGGFFLGFDGSTNKFSIGDKLTYDGTTFRLPGVTLSSNGTMSDDGGSLGQVTVRGIGYTGDLNAAAGTRLVVTGTGLTLQGNSCSRTSGSDGWNAQCYSRDAFTGGAACSFSTATASSQAVVGLSVNPTADASYESVTYGIYLDGASNEISIREFGSLPSGFTNISGAISTTDVFSVVYDGQFIRYAKNGVVFRVAPAPAGLTLYFDSSVYTVGGGITNIQLSAYANTNTSRGTSLIDPSWWKIGVAPTTYWNSSIDAGGTDAFVAGTLPDSSTGTVWQATSGTTDATSAGGGWNTSAAATNSFAVNSSKTYMFAVYVKSVSGTKGQEFWGIDSAAVCDLNTTTANTNPYFAYTNKVNGEWHLLVGYVYPAGSIGYTNAGAGAYRCNDGVKITAGTFSANYTWKATTTTASTRSFQYYQNPSAIQQFVWPQVYLCDGTEPSIDDLLSMSIKGNLAVLTTATATAQTTASNAASAAATANNAIANISSDDLLTPDEKPQIIQDYDVIIAEKSGINTQATTYGVVTENTAYNTAVTALTNYLATLTSPVLWSTISGNTTIVGTTFRTNFKNVYTARQTLLDKISTTAKTLSDAAAAAAVNTAAADATTKANTAQTNAAADATTKANTAESNAIAAAALDATTKAAAKLNKSAADTLSGPIFVSSFGGVVAGSLTWDSAGTRTGGQGVAITPKGIVGHNGTKFTFLVDATTGDANFDGTLAANTVSAASVQAGAVTAAKINITNGSTSSRVVINSNQILVYDSNNNIRVKIGSLV